MTEVITIKAVKLNFFLLNENFHGVCQSSAYWVATGLVRPQRKSDNNDNSNFFVTFLILVILFVYAVGGSTSKESKTVKACYCC